jgi:hypothetical protein
MRVQAARDRPKGPRRRVNEPVPVPLRHHPTVAGLLALQRTTGNRAVGAMLARQATKTKPADVRKDAVSATIIMDEAIGVLPLLSFHLETKSRVHVTVPSTARDADLMRYAMQGIKLDHVKISTSGFNLDLADVYIATINLSGAGDDAVVYMTLDQAAKE